MGKVRYVFVLCYSYSILLPNAMNRLGMTLCESFLVFVASRAGDGTGYNSASNSSLVRPIVLTVFGANGAVVRDIHIQNSPEWNNLVSH